MRLKRKKKDKKECKFKKELEDLYEKQLSEKDNTQK